MVNWWFSTWTINSLEKYREKKVQKLKIQIQPLNSSSNWQMNTEYSVVPQMFRKLEF